MMSIQFLAKPVFKSWVLLINSLSTNSNMMKDVV